MRKQFTFITALLLSIPVLASAGINDPITAAAVLQSNAQLDSALAETESGHLEVWRARAVVLVRTSDGEANPEDDLVVLTSGVRLQIGDRKPADEFLNELSDARLGSILQAVQGRRKRQPLDEAFARKKVAEKIIARGGMDALKPLAKLELARMTFLTNSRIREIKDAFREAANSATASNPELATRANAAIAALAKPATIADYEESMSLRSLTVDYSSREQRSWIASAIVRDLLKDGVSKVMPSRFGGNEVPLRASLRAGFDAGRTGLLNELLVASLEEQGLPLETLIEIRYYVAMDAHADGDYKKSLELFQQNIDSLSHSEYVAWSAFRAGESAMMNKQWLNAAVFYELAATDYLQYPEVAARAIYSRDVMIDSGFVSSSDFASAIGKIHQQRETSSANLANRAGKVLANKEELK